MAELFQNLAQFLIFPGFVFTVILGLVACYVVRKVSALVQWRVGPPVLQPFIDVVKLMGKEILIPAEAQKGVFVVAPLIGLAGALLLATLLWNTALWSQKLFVGDIIVAIYLMVLPSLALILGSSSSGSPHASIGTSREMKLVLGYEFALVMAFVVVIIKTAGQVEAGSQLSLAAIASTKHVPALSISGMLAFLVSILCVQAKLGYIPFDMAEAETELAGGILLEYSGALLAVWKLVEAVLLIALPLFLSTVFLGGFTGSLWAGIGKLVLILVLVILIKNTNPRMRIDQAMKFFWVYCGIILFAAIILAIIGNSYGISWL